MGRLLFRLSSFIGSGSRWKEREGRSDAWTGGRAEATFYGLLEFFFHSGLDYREALALALAMAMALLSFISTFFSSSGDPNGPTSHLPLEPSRRCP